MIDTTRTTTELLEGLFDPENEKVWQEFDARYRPIIVHFALKLGVSDADAHDVAQETLLRFMREYQKGKYRREAGRLRSWLIGIAKYRIADLRRAKGSRFAHRGDSVLVDLSDDATLTQIWDNQRRAVVLRHAIGELRATTRTSDRTIEAFELIVLHQMPAQRVAEQLDMSTHDVYLAKSRCAQKLRSIIEKVEKAYDEVV